MADTNFSMSPLAVLRQSTTILVVRRTLADPVGGRLKMKGVALSRDLQLDLLIDQAIEIRADLPEVTAVPRQAMILAEDLLQGRIERSRDFHLNRFPVLSVSIY